MESEMKDVMEGPPSTSQPVEEATDLQGSHTAPCFLILFSVAKRHNVGTITRCATAFGVKQVCLVGSNQFNTFGAHGSDAHVHFRHFPTLEGCVQQLKKEGCEIIGIEITDDAHPVHSHPFQGPTAFMLGNEGHGMTPRQMALCDKFVYISQYGVGTASLNVASGDTESPSSCLMHDDERCLIVGSGLAHARCMMHQAGSS
ncbi:Alpha/beta knot methyltransferase [Dunaliella salina]|uniref:Alpha/beta knot methyltransferase n=1 Tax=Dunaliella salina TaxID=3046 RepID=A0ABQ7GYB5_DUNSA|nr:Alpha/beta knot methyltransferase [Dunaliella salina]|eukprot:KAF5839598.1 Alpha/beta knot methyltransferase [Dunaliella salina]